MAVWVVGEWPRAMHLRWVNITASRWPTMSYVSLLVYIYYTHIEHNTNRLSKGPLMSFVLSFWLLLALKDSFFLLSQNHSSNILQNYISLTILRADRKQNYFWTKKPKKSLVLVFVLNAFSNLKWHLPYATPIASPFTPSSLFLYLSRYLLTCVLKLWST